PTGGNNSVTINVADLVGLSFNTPYKMIGYSGAIGGNGFSAFKIGALSSRALAFLTNTGSEIDLTVTGNDFIIWTGTDNLANGWDTSSQNWKLNSDGSSTAFINSPGDTVVFDDTASGTNTTINLNAANVIPANVTFNNSTNSYTLTGTKGI